MRPFDVRLAYLGKPWCTVPLEVGHDEIGDADAADWVDLEDAAAAFAALGFPSRGGGRLPQESPGQVLAEVDGLVGSVATTRPCSRNGAMAGLSGAMLSHSTRTPLSLADSQRGRGPSSTL